MKAAIGRIVQFTFPHADISDFSSDAGQSQTVPAIIVSVHSDKLVNLRIFPDSAGPSITHTSVPLRNENSNEIDGFYWEPLPSRTH